MSLLGKKSRLVLGPLLGCLGLLVLFFSVTDPTTWPQRTTHLSSSDMRIAPLVSTVWCESMVLIAEHDFAAYKIAKAPLLANRLARNTVEMEVDLDSRKSGVLELRYYLLEGSVVSIYACASQPKTFVRVYRGKLSHSCLQVPPEEQDSSEIDSDESDEVTIDVMVPDGQNASTQMLERVDCPAPLRFWEIATSFTEGAICSQAIPTSARADVSDDYTIFFISDASQQNRVKLRVTLDRTVYNVNDSRRSLHLCSAGALCVVPLAFASLDRIILWIPGEPGAGRSQFSVHSRCRPRVEFFAVLTILLPIALLFSVVCIIVRRKETQLQSRYPVCNVPYQDRTAPLLVGFRDVHGDMEQDDPYMGRRESDPPPYDLVSLQTPPPPPYSSLKLV